MQTFSAKKNNRATMIRPYELALYCVQGYDIWQETPEEKGLRDQDIRRIWKRYLWKIQPIR